MTEPTLSSGPVSEEKWASELRFLSSSWRKTKTRWALVSQNPTESAQLLQRWFLIVCVAWTCVLRPIHLVHL